MRFVVYSDKGRRGLAIQVGTEARGLFADEPGYPGDLETLIAGGPDVFVSARDALGDGHSVDLDAVTVLPPFHNPGKIVCVGLNYADHSAESGFKVPDYPAIFSRFATSLVGHGGAIVRPAVSEQLDYEGELVAVIGQGGRHIPRSSALDHVCGYSLFNDASIRDYQFKSPQWAMGKNFDGTGAFGPAFVTADELPPGCRGLRIETRLNGQVVQSASTDDLIFDIASLVSILSEAITFFPGDIIVTGTPAGVGLARKPPLWMKPGDVCEVEVEQVGVLRNSVIDEIKTTRISPKEIVGNHAGDAHDPDHRFHQADSPRW